MGIKFADDTVGVTIGTDLGKAQDYTAISIAESQLTGQDESFTIRHLERAMLGTDYTKIAIRLAELHDKLLEAVRAANTKRLAIKRQGGPSQTIIGEPEVYIDATGLGGPFIDFLRRESPKLRIVAVTITSGDKDLQQLVDEGYDKLHVGKEALIGRLQVLLGSGRIKIPSSETGKALQEELRVFRRKLSKSSGHANYGAEEGSHDDLVIATALSVWKRARGWQERIQLWTVGGTSVIYTVEQKAVAAVSQGNLVECLKEDYLRVRGALQTYAGECLDRGDGVHATIALNEVKRLDGKYRQ